MVTAEFVSAFYRLLEGEFGVCCAVYLERGAAACGDDGVWNGSEGEDVGWMGLI